MNEKDIYIWSFITEANSMQEFWNAYTQLYQVALKAEYIIGAFTVDGNTSFMDDCKFGDPIKVREVCRKAN